MIEWFKQKKKYAYILLILLVILVLGGSLYDFSVKLINNELKRGYRELNWSAKQNSLIIQNYMEQYYVVLAKDAAILRNRSLTDETCFELLNHSGKTMGIRFDRMGIVDHDGNALLSTGEEFQIKDEVFFQKAIAGEYYMTDSAEDGVFTVIVSGPVIGWTGAIKGVLFGEIRIEDMDLFSEIENEEHIKYLYLMNTEGTYILKGGTITHKDTLHNMLAAAELDKQKQLITSEEDIMEGVKKRKSMQFSLDWWNRGEIVVMIPLSDSDWYLYEVTDREYIDQEIRLYQKDVLLLTVKIMALVVVVAGIYIYYSGKEQKKVKELYDQMCLNEETYRVTAEHSNQCVFTYDSKMQTIHFMNDKYQDYGIPNETVELSWVYDVLKKDNPSAYYKAARVVASVADYEPEIERELFLKINGANRFLRVQLVNLFDDKKQVVRSIGMLEDITEQKESTMMMRREQEFRKSLLTDCLGYMEVDVTEDRVMENSFSSHEKANRDGSFTEMMVRYAEHKILPEYREKAIRYMSSEGILDCFSGKIYDSVFEYQSWNDNGDVFWIVCEIRVKQSEDRDHVIAYLVYRDIDEKKKEQMKLEKEATLDILTGALKRMTAKERIDRIIQTSISDDNCHVFLMLDMDNFKTLNDTLGHMCGDQALIHLVEVAKENCRRDDIICRLGGDEFIIFLKDVPRNVLHRKIEFLQRQFETTYQKDNIAVTVTASIGAALVPDQGTTFEELYAAADKELYKVKFSNKGSYSIAESASVKEE